MQLYPTNFIFLFNFLFESPCDHAQTESPQNRDFKIYVGNLEATIDDVCLEHQFSAYGDVISAKVISDSNGLSFGFGFLVFSSLYEATSIALDRMNRIILNGKLLLVSTNISDVTSLF